MTRKNILQIVIAAIMLIPATAMGQTYTALWNKVKEAENKDLPKTQIAALRQIEERATREKAYGQLLKASLTRMGVTMSLSADSLTSVEAELKLREGSAPDAVVRAVYAATLYRLYTGYTRRIEGADSLAAQYRTKAMANPKVLAAAGANGYDPMVAKGYNASVFNGDMLSVIGYEVEDFHTLCDHYMAAGNRQAACITGLEWLRQHRPETAEGMKKSEYLQSVDSIIHCFGDYDIACEAAIERYEYMGTCPDVTVEDKIRYIHYALDKWGGWQGANRFRNAEKELTAPMACVELERKTTQPGVAQMVHMPKLRNVKGVTLRIYRLGVGGDTQLNPQNDEGYRKLKAGATELTDKNITRSYMEYPAYQEFSDSVMMPALPVGVYMIEAQTSPATQAMRSLYFVTGLHCLSLSLPDNTMRFVVVDATTGQPVPGAKVRLRRNYNRAGERTVTLTCDAKGEVTYKSDDARARELYIYTDKDKAYPQDYHYRTFYYNGRDSEHEHTALFTDRQLYRPGQTVHVAAVVYTVNGPTESHAVEGKKVKAALRDANYKVVEEKELVTDRFGSCSTDFILPTGVLNGFFSVAVNGQRTYINVEEYKRPTFTVEFPKVNEKYGNGDTLMVRAKATTYAGVPVQDAKVSYTVTRRPALWWRCWYNPGGDAMANTVVYRGTTTTGSDGTFAVEMPMILPEGLGRTAMFYNFTVSADVTDMAGETHNGTMSVPLGNRETAFSCDMAENVLGDSLKTVTFRLQNAAGMAIDADVRFGIDSGQPTLTARTGVPFALTERLKSGRHSIFAVCEKDTLRQEFTVFGLDDTVPCVETKDWFYVSDDSFADDKKPVTVQVGSSDKDVHIAYSIIAGDKVIESGAVDKTAGLVNRKLTYKEEYGNGLLLNFAWVKDGKSYTHTATIRRPLPDRHLTVKWTTFRDRLTPGQTEEWSLNITRPDGKPADALLMATMYDKSLDQIAAHGWNFNDFAYLSIPSSTWRTTTADKIWMYGEQPWKALSQRDFSPSRLDPAVMAQLTAGYRYYGGIMTRQQVMMKSASPTLKIRGTKMMAMSDNAAAGAVMESAKEEKVFDAVEQLGAAKAEDETDGGGRTADVQLRENLNETAFFIPDAVADKDGNVTLRFTLPECLTTWRMLGFAHTTDMMYCSIEGETVARKEVMVQPNVPRFVRVGDKATVSARIFNTGEAVAQGTARLELIDPETEKVVLTRTQAFSVKPAETAAVTFDYAPDDTHTLLICRVTATGKTFSDGEQHYLPILPNRERVTVTVPFTQHEAGTKTIDLTTLFPKKSANGKLTVEYTNNPAWLMVQALPSVGTPQEDNAISLSAALYANIVASHILKQNPKAKTTFAQWKQEQANGGTSLQSSLTTNSTLKDIVLAETPWVADADREADQKQRLGEYFDESSLQHRTSTIADKLQALQRPDGSWSWWKGMDGSIYMTIEVAQTLVRMNTLTGRQPAYDKMLDRAFGYMGKEIVRIVADMRKQEKKGHKATGIGSTALRYLYLSALDGRKQTANVKSACDYLIGILKKEIKQQSLYDKALTAIVLAKHGETARSREYVQSLKEYTVYTEEAGRYYDTDRAGYSWCDYRIPTETAVIEAIATITPEDKQTIDEMRRWLLHEKRTQAWDTPINSVNAVYSFLKGNATALAPQSKTTLAIDGKPMELPTATAGLGYVKTSTDKTDGRTFTATKTSEGTSWGAVYAQFMQPTTDIEASGSGLTVKREMLVDGKKVGGNAVNVGEKVTVRITIEAKRDFDFMQVLDRRAACMEPAKQLSGYRNGAYCSPKDNSTNSYYDRMAKGKHTIETEYYIDRAGTYETGTCTVGCAYAPEYRATAKSETITAR